MSCICLLIYASFLINYMPPDAQTAGVYGADTAVAMILNASEDKLSGIFRGHDDGSNGFRRLSDFRASEYDTPEGRRTKRTMKRILATYDHPMLMDRIAGKNLLSLLGYEKGPAHIRSATHALSDPKYLITESGIIVLGKRRLIAPWNDIITFWYTIDCYFVGFDGQVALIRSADINTSRKPSMAGIIEVPLESLHYEYPGSDNAEREDDGFRPPEFIDGGTSLEKVP